MLLILAVLGLKTVPALVPDQNSFPVTIRVDATKSKGELHPIYRFFGADEPNFATMKDGRKLLSALGSLGSQQAYFRTHNLLNTGDGTPALKWGSTNVYTEDEGGNPVYDWTVLDRIFDTYLQRGVRPYAQIGFMPQALSQKPVPYQHEWRPGLPYNEIYTGWSFPPRDYSKWAELVYRWVKHCIDRYGQPEVQRWYWEVWNEPNIRYWSGTPEEFYRLHDYGIDAVRRALPGARVGGPDTAGDGGKFMQDFLEHCLRGTNAATGRTGTPIDFVSFHAKGSPRFVDGHVQLGIAAKPLCRDPVFDGAAWSYLGTAHIKYGEGEWTHWAPEVVFHQGTYHMYLTLVPGVFTDWNHPRDLLHLTSSDLLNWQYEATLKLSSDRVIDACVSLLSDGSWRLWYNNERDRKSIYYADSRDRYRWEDRGRVVGVGERPAAGPEVFRWKDRYWMIVDVWKGLGVYRSDEALLWTAQSGNLVETPGKGLDDEVKGGHADVVVSGDRAFLFYFTHPGRRATEQGKDGYEQRRSSIQVAELEYQDGWITCDRDQPTHILLQPPAESK